MSSVLSIRFPDAVVSRLQVAARGSGQTASGLAQRLVDEGLRMATHPSVVFRSGPAGRRAALMRGPDVWEVIAVIRHLDAHGDDAVDEAAAWLGLSTGEVRAALAYFGDYPAEVDEMITANDAEADRIRAAWEAQQQLLA